MRRLLSGAVVVAAVLLGTAAPALADDPTLTRAKTEVTRRIDLRLAALHRFDTTIGQAERLTDAHETALHGLVTVDINGLTALRTKVQGETTREAVRADAAAMINEYRVFILVGPKVRLTVAGDNESAAITRLATAHGKLADLVAKAKAGGADTAAAEQDLADMQAAIDKAKADLAGQLDTLLALQPGPDGDAIRAKVAGVRRALGSTRSDLKTAVAEAKHVRDFLKTI